MNSVMKLKEMFIRCFGFPIPKSLISKEFERNFVPLEIEVGDALLFGSKVAVQKPFLVQADLTEFIEICPEGYLLVGFWGHGINSYAFYYSRVNSWSKIFFRLPYGGVYMDNKKMAGWVRKFLRSYIQFEKDIKDKARSLIAIDSMCEGYYKLEMSRGRIIELKESLLAKPNFKQRLLMV